MATARHPLFAVPLAAALLATGGCILLISPPSGGEHCRFRGAETSCGACLASRCQSQIDAICIDDDPSSVLAIVEQCAAVGDEACGRIAPSEVATCLSKSCAAYCYRKTGQSLTQCEESFLAPGLACSCGIDARPNDLTCSSGTFPRTRCCAPAGWPGPALRCACDAVACVPTSDGCICTLTDNLTLDTASECQGPHCCAVEDRCQCRRRACSGGEREVASCNLEALSCPNGTSEVAACSIRQ